jgi:hypothetical protein
MQYSIKSLRELRQNMQTLFTAELPIFRAGNMSGNRSRMTLVNHFIYTYKLPPKQAVEDHRVVRRRGTQIFRQSAHRWQ